MYHYTESGLNNIWLVNGYKTRGDAVAIADVFGLNKVIGTHIANKSHITGKEFRFLRKELDLSQSRFASWIGLSEDMVSKWERLGRVPKYATRFIQAIYLEKVNGNVSIGEMVERMANLDREESNKLVFEDTQEGWKEAA